MSHNLLIWSLFEWVSLGLLRIDPLPFHYFAGSEHSCLIGYAWAYLSGSGKPIDIGLPILLEAYLDISGND